MLVNGQYGFTDIHNHCLFGIDDGAETFSSTANMLIEAAADGVTTIVTTPHIAPGSQNFNFRGYDTAFAMARDFVRERKLNLKLIRGFEILYTNSVIRFLDEGTVGTLGDSGAVLVEFYPDDTERRIFEGVRRLVTTGYQPIIAHVERCEALHRSEQVRQLKDEGALIQINANTVLRKHTLLRQRYINSIIDKGLVDFVASDAHDLPGQGTKMTMAFGMLTDRIGLREASRLCRDNAADLLRL